MAAAVDVAGFPLPGRTLRLVVTVLVTVGLLAAYRTIYAYGGWFKQWFSDPAVEVGQGLVGVAVTVGGLWLFVDIWATSSQVLGAGTSVGLDGATTIRLTVTFGLFVGAYLLTRLSKRVIQAVFEGDRVSVHQREIGHHIIQVGIYGAATLLILALWDVPLGRLLIGAGAATIVMGLAARQTLGSLLAGFVLLFARPFEIGDWVVVGDQEGIVRDINIVKTQLRTFDDEHVMIPNDKVTGSDIVNRSREGRLRVSLELRLDYDAGVDRAVEALGETLRDLDAESVLDEPEPQVVVKRLEPSAVILELRVWIDEPSPGRMWAVKTAMADAATRRFETEGIDIPFPKREFATAGPSGNGADAGTVGAEAVRDVVDDGGLTAEGAALLASLIDDAATADPDAEAGPDAG